MVWTESLFPPRFLQILEIRLTQQNQLARDLGQTGGWITSGNAHISLMEATATGCCDGHQHRGLSEGSRHINGELVFSLVVMVTGNPCLEAVYH